jgi:hypothetical protein
MYDRSGRSAVLFQKRINMTTNLLDIGAAPGPCSDLSGGNFNIVDPA